LLKAALHDTRQSVHPSTTILIHVQVLIDSRAVDAKDAVLAISTEASQEAALEEMLAKVVARWAGIEFSVIPYKESKDVFILGAIDDIQVWLLGMGVGVGVGGRMSGMYRVAWEGKEIELVIVSAQSNQPIPKLKPQNPPPQTALEDSLVAMSTILSSRYVGGIRGEVERVERQLSTFSDTLDEWVQVR